MSSRTDPEKANFAYLAQLNAAEKARHDRDEAIRAEHAAGASMTTIAKRLGITRQRVGQIVGGDDDE